MNREDRDVSGRPSTSDPATPEEREVIDAAMAHATESIRGARKALAILRPSDDYQRALDALADARRIIEAYAARAAPAEAIRVQVRRQAG
jgi:hypothetical protein